MGMQPSYRSIFKFIRGVAIEKRRFSFNSPREKKRRGLLNRNTLFYINRTEISARSLNHKMIRFLLIYEKQSVFK